jgi:hypothetical protein
MIVKWLILNCVIVTYVVKIISMLGWRQEDSCNVPVR